MALVIKITAQNKQAVEEIRRVAREAGAKVEELGAKTKAAAAKTTTAWSGALDVIKRFAGPIGVGAAILGIKRMLSSVIDFGDKIGKMSKATGISTELLSGLGFAAERSGASFEGATRGVRNLLRRMQDVKDGLIEGRRAFDEIGVSVQDSSGQMRDVEDVMLDVADRFKTMTSETERAALAQEIFGRAGLELVPLLREGREGIEKLTARAQELGIVLDQEAAQKAEDAKDAMTDFGTALRGLSIRLTADVLPPLTKVTNALADLFALIDKKRDFGIIGQLLMGDLSDRDAVLSFLEQAAEKEGVVTEKARAHREELEELRAAIPIEEIEEFRDVIPPDFNPFELTRKEAEAMRRPLLDMANSASVARDRLKDWTPALIEAKPEISAVGIEFSDQEVTLLRISRMIQRDIANAITDLIFKARSLGDIFSGILKSVVRIGIELGVRALAAEAGIPTFQHGGLAPGGLALVGERGPELVNLPRGAQVITAERTREIIRETGNSINVTVTARSFDRNYVKFELIPMIRRELEAGQVLKR